MPSQLTRWRKDGTLWRMHDRLREQAREKDGRKSRAFCCRGRFADGTNNGHRRT